MKGRVMLAATGSGRGKTSAVCAVLGALKRRGTRLAAFKCGPDYIDPMFHKTVLGVGSRNLDSYLCAPETVRYLMAKNTPPDAFAVVEGVMGYYDGAAGSAAASSHEIAEITQTPVVLVTEPGGRSLSAAAELSGYLGFRPNNIRGILLNRISERLYQFYKNMIEEHCRVPVLGFLPDIPQAAVASRHLGLVAAGEIEDIDCRIGLLASAAEAYVDLDALLELASQAQAFEAQTAAVPNIGGDIPIGVARDEAFCFYYDDNLDLLREMGAKLVEFSPIRDKSLPKGLRGLLLGGGYPELHARAISENRAMLHGIRAAIAAGMPTIAECGGFMALCAGLEYGGEIFQMAGAVDTVCRVTGRLERFGYRELTASRDNLLCEKGGVIRAHEFRYSAADNEGDGFWARRPGKDGQIPAIHAGESLFAGYPHLHLWGNISFAERFLRKAAKWEAV